MVFPYLECTVGFATVEYIWETYLTIRQRGTLNKPIPSKLKEHVDSEKYSKSQAYSYDKNNFSLVCSAYNQIEFYLILYFGVYPLLWNSSKPFVTWEDSDQVYQSLVFLGFLQIISLVTSLPFELYSTFVIEQRHGFNKQTIGLFFKDKAISFALTIAIGAPVVVAILHLIRWGGPYFYVYVWAFLLTFTLIMVYAYPVLIAPLFNKYVPLPEGELREGIEKLAKSIDFPLTKLYQVDGSKRSAHSNAYFFGFWKNKRIVIYDTLMEQVDKTSSILAIVGHELGHWWLGHTVKNLVVAQVQMISMFALFGEMMNSDAMFESFGFVEKPLIIALMIFFNFILSPVNALLGFLVNMMSRKFEYEADKFAVELDYGEELKYGLIKIHSENLSNLNPDPWYSAFHYSHPTLLERMGAIDAEMKRRK